MIRRIYVLPLKAGLTESEVANFVADFAGAGEHIPGLLDSFAAVDQHSDTVVWEMNFRDEETYTGPYMVHPYHIATLDSYLLGDSPERRSYDFGASRYRIPESAQRLRAGIRRIVLMRLPEGADTSVIEEIAARGEGMATSVFGSDDLAYKSGKGLNWTHVWEQAFNDVDHLERYLKSPEGIACSNRDGFRALGIGVPALRVLTYPFELKPDSSPPEPQSDRSPVIYAMTAQLAPENVDTFVDLLVSDYDPPLARFGGKLLHRFRTWDHSSRDAEVQSVWQLDSFEAFKDFRTATSSAADDAFNHFVVNAMPLVKRGTRRFYRQT